DLELVATVLRPRGFIRALGDRPFLTEAHDLNAAFTNPVVHEVLLRRGGATLAEREVVLVGATLVGVAGDANHHVHVRLENPRLHVQVALGVVADIGLVEVEVDDRGERGAHIRRLTRGPVGRLTGAVRRLDAVTHARRFAGTVRRVDAVLTRASRTTSA